MLRSVAAVCVILCVPATASTQVHNRIEIQAGGGYPFGGGAIPSLPLLEVQLVAWLSPHWGVAVTQGWTLGRELNDPPSVGSDRTFVGQEGATYTTVTVRRREAVSPAMLIEVGGGLTWGSYEDIESFHDEPGQEFVFENAFGGLTFEVHAVRRMTSHWSGKTGAVLTLSPETSDLRFTGAIAFGF
jgi:hypothetical protein